MRSDSQLESKIDIQPENSGVQLVATAEHTRLQQLSSSTTEAIKILRKKIYRDFDRPDLAWRKNLLLCMGLSTTCIGVTLGIGALAAYATTRFIGDKESGEISGIVLGSIAFVSLCLAFCAIYLGFSRRSNRNRAFDPSSETAIALTESEASTVQSALIDVGSDAKVNSTTDGHGIVMARHTLLKAFGKISPIVQKNNALRSSLFSILSHNPNEINELIFDYARKSTIQPNRS